MLILMNTLRHQRDTCSLKALNFCLEIVTVRSLKSDGWCVWISKVSFIYFNRFLKFYCIWYRLAIGFFYIKTSFAAWIFIWLFESKFVQRKDSYWAGFDFSLRTILWGPKLQLENKKLCLENKKHVAFRKCIWIGGCLYTSLLLQLKIPSLT